MPRILVGFALAAALAAPACAAQLSRDTFGCRALASADQLAALHMAGDRAAYADSLGRLARAGQCREWAAGEQVVVKDREDGLVCLAPKDVASLCYWTPPTAVE